MENLKRKIKLFFVAYGKLLFEIISVIILIIIGLQVLNKRSIEQKEVKQINNNMTYKVENSISNEKEEKVKEDKEYISKFIDYCNTGKIEEAYDMISSSCKQEKFSSINEFKVRYIDVLFSTKIYEYKILKNNDEYIIELTENPLNTGKNDSVKKTKYKLIEDILTRKIYIY